MKTHIFYPDPADLTGQACAVYGCNLRKSNAIHVGPEQLREAVGAVDWSEPREEPADDA